MLQLILHLCLVTQWSSLRHSITAISIATARALLQECQVEADLLCAQPGSETPFAMAEVQRELLVKS